MAKQSLHSYIFEPADYQKLQDRLERIEANLERLTELLSKSSMEPDSLYTIQEAAEFLKCTKPTHYKLIKNNVFDDMPPRRIGGKLMFSAESLKKAGKEVRFKRRRAHE